MDETTETTSSAAAVSPPPSAPDAAKASSPPSPPGGSAIGTQAEGKKASPATGSAQAALLGTGRRKRSIARVRLIPGIGTILINKKPYDQYFVRESLRLAVRAPLLLTHQLGKMNVVASVEGGGMTGQAGAVRLGVARALLKLDEAYRAGLRGGGFLTRDPREKERKKYGHKGARKRFQWTKR